MKLDLENDNVFELETTKDKVRSFFDGVELETAFPDFETTVDSAQGWIMQHGKEAFVVIRIK